MKNNYYKLLIKVINYSFIGLFCQLFLAGLCIANDADAQKVKSIEEVGIEARYYGASLAEIFKDIESQTDFIFTYDKKDSFLKERYTNDKGKITVADLFRDISARKNLIFQQINNNISVRKKHNENEKSPKPVINLIDVSGSVTSAEGNPLPGVNILVKGTSIGTVTDMDGNYSINMPDENNILVFSFIGYTTQEVAVNGRSTISVTLAEDVHSLEEIVVVGYGVQKKVNLTGAISTVEFDDEVNNRPITNASQALGGTASGIWVSQNSGQPGSDGAQIRVRGWGTLNNSNPLIIIDGVEGSFDQINPNDIKNISVLKDAASAAIYGSKAANGVILITTKRGRQNEEMQVNVNSYVGLQSLGRRFDVITNSAEHMELTNQALANEGSSPVFPDYLITEFRNGNDPYKYPNTDWFDELFKTATIQEHNVSVNGGSEKLSSFLSFNYLNHEGMVPNTNSQRYGLRANVESNLNDWLTLSAKINYIKRDSEEMYGSLSRVSEMLGGAAPYIAPYTRDGRFGSVQAIDKDGSLLYDNRNPLIDAANGLARSEENILTLNVSTDVDFNKHLSLKTTISSNQKYNLSDRYNTTVFGYTDTGIETITKNYNRSGLDIRRSQFSRTQNNLFSTINYNKQFAGIHDVSAIAGIQLETNRIKNVYARRSEAPKEGLTQVDAGTSGIQGKGNMVGLNIFSYFGRVNYSFLNKYLFEANIRADGSSRFGEANRWGVFPGFSAGWRLSEEEFIQKMGVFSNLKLRTSWGQLGNQRIAGYWPYLTVINQNNNLSYNYGGSLAPGAAVTALVDEKLTWETSSSLDIGIEIGLLEDRISIEADYFQKKTEDILVRLPIPLIMGGITAPYENVGEMTNNGFEFIVNYNNLKLERGQIGINMGLNLTYVNNEVTKFRGGDSPDQLYLIREGYSYNTLYGYNAIGIYQSDNEALEHMHSNSFKPSAGNLKFEDVNNDGRLTFEDKQDLGNTLPKLTFGFSPSFQYQGFDLNFLFQGIVGVNLYTRNNFTNFHWENRVFSTRWRDAWSPQNTDTDIPSVRFSNSWENQPSSFWVKDIDFVKLKNVQLGYTLPNGINSRLGLEKIYIYANGQNVFTLVNGEYEGYDPERNTFDSGEKVYPIPRIISFGINVNF